MATLGLETWDDTEPMTVDELVSEEDWLDVWIKSIDDDDKSTDVEMVDAANVLMDDVNMELDLVEIDYMVWLVAELKELNVDEDIINNMRILNLDDKGEVHTLDDDKSECLRNVHCNGNCNSECLASWEVEKNGNILQDIQGSTQLSIQVVFGATNNGLDWRGVGGVMHEGGGGVQ